MERQDEDEKGRLGEIIAACIHTRSELCNGHYEIYGHQIVISHPHLDCSEYSVVAVRRVRRIG